MNGVSRFVLLMTSAAALQVTGFAEEWSSQYEFWITPYGFLKGAMADNATVESKTVMGTTYRDPAAAWRLPVGQSAIYRVPHPRSLFDWRCFPDGPELPLSRRTRPDYRSPRCTKMGTLTRCNQRTLLPFSSQVAEKCLLRHESTVGAVYDRTYFLDSTKYARS
jgi:hypothetical protein